MASQAIVEHSPHERSQRGTSAHTAFDSRRPADRGLRALPLRPSEPACVSCNEPCCGLVMSMISASIEVVFGTRDGVKMPSYRQNRR